MRIALITRHIGHYHDARFRAAAAVLDDFVVVPVSDEAAFPEFLAAGMPAYQVERPFGDAKAYRAATVSGELGGALWRTLDRLFPAIVVLSGWASPESRAAIAWGCAKGRRTVVMSESQKVDAARSPWREAVKRRIVRLCDAALVGGPTHRDYAITLGMPEARIALGYDAVDNDHFERGSDRARKNAAGERTRLGLPARYLLASGRFIPKKNFPTLVRAYALAVDRCAEAPDLVILGDGEGRSDIEHTIRDAGIGERVHLPGFRGYEDLPSIYGLAEGFAHVSQVEQWGLVANEAAASALPLVVSRPCGAAEVLVEDGGNGFLVDPTSVKDIAATLERLFRLSPEQRVSMGAASRAIVADWGAQRFAEGLKAACEAASTAPQRRIAPWDRALLAALSRRRIEKVA